MKFLKLTMVASSLLFASACGRSAAPPGTPTGPSPSATGTQWSGTVELKSASPSGSCEADYVAGHPQLLNQPATAAVEANRDFARMTLRTADGQRCVFSGTGINGALSLESGHETCDGYPISNALIGGIGATCGAIDLAGDGPYWGRGSFSGEMSASQIDGRWVWEVFDPGGGGSRATRFTVEVAVHMRQQ